MAGRFVLPNFNVTANFYLNARGPAPVAGAPDLTALVALKAPSKTVVAAMISNAVGFRPPVSPIYVLAPTGLIFNDSTSVSGPMWVNLPGIPRPWYLLGSSLPVSVGYATEHACLVCWPAFSS